MTQPRTEQEKWPQRLCPLEVTMALPGFPRARMGEHVLVTLGSLNPVQNAFHGTSMILVNPGHPSQSKKKKETAK